jgi:hypothetical protein
MKRIFISLVALLALSLMPVSAAAVSHQVSTPTVSTAGSFISNPNYTGGRYTDLEICIHQLFSGSNWVPGDLGNSFEPAVITGWRSASQGCGDYPGWQVMRVALYSASDGMCTKWSGTTEAANTFAGHPENPWYNRLWTAEVSYPTVWINQHYNSTCWDTQTERDNRLGREMANVLGLIPYSSCAGTIEYAISNTCYQLTRETAIGRNRLSILMNPA